MSFLQPMLLAALPLVALPIIIHLINQRRYQTVRWAAMMFLLAANRMSRGYARLRQWLIMAARMAAIAGLLFAVSRPLAGGWLGLAAGGRPDTTIVLLDRSPSMEQGGPRGSGSKRATGLRQLARTLATIGSTHWVLIDSGSNTPRAIESPAALESEPEAGPCSASADVPAMLESARDYVAANKSGRTEVWICSDVRRNDWNSDSARWQALREGFKAFPQGVRFHLLAYADPAPSNLSVRVTEVKRRKTAEGAELLLSLRLVREGGGDGKASMPVQFAIEGARSELMVEMAGARYDLKDYRIVLEKGHERGWGKVSIPADENTADNDFYFAYDEPVPRRAVIVADDPQTAAPLTLAAEIAPEASITCQAEVVEAGKLAAVEWDGVSLLMWQAPLPEGEDAARVKAFVERGGQVLFFPPRAPGEGTAFGVRWTDWKSEDNGVPVESWRGDEDLLAHTQSGSALPVGEIQVRRYCGLSGERTPLGVLRGGAPLLARAVTSGGGAYFCATTPALGDSSLATNGVVLYVLVQRALAAGADALEGARQLVAGAAPKDTPALWKRLAGTSDALSTDYPLHRGIYQAGDRLLAVNRSVAEDAAPVLADRAVAELFQGLDFARVDDRAGSLGSLIQEIWRVFLVAMIGALLVEAGLCLPKRPQVRPGPGGTS